MYQRAGRVPVSVFARSAPYLPIRLHDFRSLERLSHRHCRGGLFKLCQRLRNLYFDIRQCAQSHLQYWVACSVFRRSQCDGEFRGAPVREWSEPPLWHRVRHYSAWERPTVCFWCAGTEQRLYAGLLRFWSADGRLAHVYVSRWWNTDTYTHCYSDGNSDSYINSPTDAYPKVRANAKTSSHTSAETVVRSSLKQTVWRSATGDTGSFLIVFARDRGTQWSYDAWSHRVDSLRKSPK